MTLTVQFTLSFKLTNQTFTPEKTADKTFPRFTDFELECLFKRDDVSRINGILTVDIDFIDGSKAVQE